MYRFSGDIFTLALILICWLGCETWWVCRVTLWCVGRSPQPARSSTHPTQRVEATRPGRHGCQLPDGPARQPPSMKAEPALGQGFGPCRDGALKCMGRDGGHRTPGCPRGGRVSVTCPQGWLWGDTPGWCQTSLWALAVPQAGSWGPGSVSPPCGHTGVLSPHTAGRVPERRGLLAERVG